MLLEKGHRVTLFQVVSVILTCKVMSDSGGGIAAQGEIMIIRERKAITGTVLSLCK